jgi:hypothetical protein
MEKNVPIRKLFKYKQLYIFGSNGMLGNYMLKYFNSSIC